MNKLFRTTIIAITMTLCAAAGFGETITLDFSYDGAGSKCYTLTATNDAFYINSWNTNKITINGVDITNTYIWISECGTYTIEYESSVQYSHIEFKRTGTCSGGSDPTPVPTSNPTGDITPVPTSVPTSAPTSVAGGSAVLIEAEDYTAYYDSTSGNVIGNQYSSTEAYDGIIRNDGVDIEDCELGGGNICWVTQNEWLEYELSNIQTGTYNIWVRAANGGGSAGTAEITIDGSAVATVSVSNNSLGDWQHWVNVPAGTGISISNGSDLRITFTNSNAFNLDALYLTPNSNDPPPTPAPVSASGSVVSQYGSLQVAYTEQYGNTLCNQNGDSVQLRGFSLHHTRYHWLAGRQTIPNMVNQFGVDVVRVTQYVESNMKGYLENTRAEAIMWERTKQYIRDAIAAGIYVIVDWHIHADQGEMSSLKSEAQSFFTDVKNFLNSEYGGIPNNIIWEIYNEPIFGDWNTIKSFATDIISTIRGFDSDGIIIAGTPNWCQNPDAVINNELSGSNIMYAIHFYAAQHTDTYRAYVQTALNADLPLFATEWGVCGYDPTQSSPNIGQSQTWMTLLHDNNISWTNWSLTWKPEASSALKEGTWITGPWTLTNYTDSNSDLTESGWFVKQQLDSSKPASVSSGSNVTPAPTSDTTPAPTSETTPAPTAGNQPGTGQILRQKWENLSDDDEVVTLTSLSSYPDNPDSSGYLNSFEAPRNDDEGFGCRVIGYLYPTVSGNYTFWLASDDESELWLSTDSNESNRQLIAHVFGHTDDREWDKYSSQQSASINLSAGSVYFIEAIMREGHGGDNLAVAWQPPGGSREVIPGSYLSPYTPGN